MVLFANIDFRAGVGPGFGKAGAAQLEADIKAGALGLKVFKDLGLRLRKTTAHGSPWTTPNWIRSGRPAGA